MNNKKNILTFLFLLPFLGLFAQEKSDKIEMPEKGICAHCGAMETHPENTLSAFEEAIRLTARL